MMRYYFNLAVCIPDDPQSWWLGLRSKLCAVCLFLYYSSTLCKDHHVEMLRVSLTCWSKLENKKPNSATTQAQNKKYRIILDVYNGKVSNRWWKPAVLHSSTTLKHTCYLPLCACSNRVQSNNCCITGYLRPRWAAVCLCSSHKEHLHALQSCVSHTCWDNCSKSTLFTMSFFFFRRS